MSCATDKRRSRSHIETEAEADAARFGEGDDSSDASSPAPSDGYKRMRLRGGRGAPSQLEMNGDEEDQENGDEFQSFATADGNVTPPHTNGHATANGESATEFSPGAIVRVKVENFVTYEKAEFFPGPNLNMVIGPNGTGKSSLVCAICLGLGYPASTLGRATSFGEFVKHGKEHAIVEVELQKRPQDRANYVVRLKINREDNTRNFWLNKQSCTHTSIKKLMQKLRIQIDNLCQFLPQDKVSEFAGLNSIDLLNKTLQAAAPEEVIQQQFELRTLFDDQKALQRSLETEVETLRSLQTRQQGLQADVERLREREQIQKVVTDLKDCRLVADYNEKKALFDQLKEQKKRAKEKLRRLEQLNEPSLADVNSKEQYQKKIDVVLKARRRRAVDAEVDVGEALKAIENANEETKNLENDKNAERESMTKRKQQVSEQRTKVTKLEGQYKNGRGVEDNFNPAEWNHKIRELQNRQMYELKDKSQEIGTAKDEAMERGRRKQEELKSIQQEITNLDSQEGQRLQQLRRVDSDVAKAYEWLQESQSQFEKEVFGPPLLNCSMKDKRYSNHVQSLLQRDDFLCFTAQTKADHKKLTDQFFKKMNLACTVRTIMTDLSAFRHPVPQDDLKALGLDGYALDFVEGPTPVLAMLCSEKKLHLTGVAMKDISDQQYEAISDGDKITSFATGSTMYRVTRRREYGPGATSVITKSIHAGRFWTDEPIDTAAKTEIERRYKECQRDYSEVRQEFADVTAKQTELDQEVKVVREEIRNLERQKAALQREFNQWKALPDAIEVQKKNLQRARDELEESRQNLLSYDDKFDRLALKKAKLVLRHQEQLSVLRDANHAVLEAHIRHIEALSDVTALKERNSGIVQRLEEERRKVEELDRQVEQAKSLARNAQNAIKELLTVPDSDGEMDTERRDYLIGLTEGKTVETITEDIETEHAKLDLIHAADPGVLRDFEKRARDIEKLEAENITKRTDLEQLNERIQELREVWEPALDSIIRRINDAFSYNFEQISCAGEVGVHKDEDFDKWAIEIKVKFRENETLQKLDQHRQSGGERAVSTIFYLMSLQSMAQAPFRVVDEINQGMDPRNERMVHERMVEIACREHTSQYFLITPKLLSGLRYDERMKILCIASGEHMPAEGGKLDFARCVKVKKRLMAAASA